MYLLLSLIVIVLLIGLGVSRTDKDWRFENLKKRNAMEDKVSTFATFARSWIFCLSLAIIIVFGCVKIHSYTEYVKLRATYDATIEQYASAVEIYQGKAVIDIESAAWTDLKYQGYQKNMGEIIKSLRNKLITYNNNLIQKRIYKKSPFFNWWVVGADPDMKIMSMLAISSHKIKG